MRATVAAAFFFAAVWAHAQGGGPPALRWQRVRSYDGKFSFSMPGQPAYKTNTMTARNGQPVRHTTYLVDFGRSAYLVATTDYDNKTRLSLDRAIEGVLSSWEKPRIVERRREPLYGHPGQTVDFASGKYRVIVRAFTVGGRLYQLNFVERMDEFVPAHADAFMRSFQLR
jgi:hypothetical protein